MTSSTVARPTLQWNARTWGALIVLCGALFLDGLDVSMVGMALPSIRTDLHLSTSSLQWIVSGYVLGYGGLLLLGGRAADLLGGAASSCSRSRIRRGLAARRARQQPGPADRHPLHQGRCRRVHRAGGPLHHHHLVPRRPRPQPGAVDLHRVWCQRLLDGPDPGRPADRGRLALDLPIAGADRAGRPGRRPQTDRQRRSR